MRSASGKRLPKERRCLKSRVTERGRRDWADIVRIRGYGAAAVLGERAKGRRGGSWTSSARRRGCTGRPRPGFWEEAAQAQMEEQFLAINPAELQRRIELALRAVWTCSERSERRKVG